MGPLHIKQKGGIMADKLRQFTKDEIQMLQIHNDHSEKDTFSPEDLMLLISGNPTFKLHCRAEKALGKQRTFFNTAPSRKEAYQSFVAQVVFEAFVEQHIQPLALEHIAIRELLIAKGMLTDEEIDEAVKKKKESLNKPAAANIEEEVQDDPGKPEDTPDKDTAA